MYNLFFFRNSTLTTKDIDSDTNDLPGSAKSLRFENEFLNF